MVKDYPNVFLEEIPGLSLELRWKNWRYN